MISNDGVVNGIKGMQWSMITINGVIDDIKGWIG